MNMYGCGEIMGTLLHKLLEHYCSSMWASNKFDSNIAKNILYIENDKKLDWGAN